jgi:methyl-accepting chemotaxis protein
MTLDPQETLREIALQSQLLALGAALEAASAEQYGQSLARTAAELRRLAETAAEPK